MQTALHKHIPRYLGEPKLFFSGQALIAYAVIAYLARGGDHAFKKLYIRHFQREKRHFASSFQGVHSYVKGQCRLAGRRFRAQYAHVAHPQPTQQTVYGINARVQAATKVVVHDVVHDCLVQLARLVLIVGCLHLLTFMAHQGVYLRQQVSVTLKYVMHSLPYTTCHAVVPQLLREPRQQGGFS